MNKKIKIGIGLFVWNGQETIKETLLSLLHQTHKNFKIYILDNQSSDDTVKIIKELLKIKKYKKKIKLIIDKKKRSIPDAQKFIMKKYLLKYKYCIIANDDDIYKSKYIEILLRKIKLENLDMVYSLKKRINSENKILKTKNYPLYGKKNLYFLNALKYLIYRNHWQVSFGLYKTRTYQESMKYYKYIDNSKTNYDNINMFYYLLNYKIECSRNYLFLYREKERSTIKRNKIINRYNNSIFSFFLIYKSQYYFTKIINKIIWETKSVNNKKKLILTLSSLITFLQKTTFYNIRKLLK